MSDLPLSGILLLTDLDGTLLDANSEISQQNLAAIKEFVTQGGMFSIATGRVEQSVRDYVQQLPINVPAILYNGAVIYDLIQQKALRSAQLPVDLLSLIHKIQSMYFEIGIEIYAGSKVYFVQENKYTEEQKQKEKFVVHSAPLDSIITPWEKVLLAWHPAELDRVEVFLRDVAMDIHVVRSEAQFLEILPQGISKGSALNYLKQVSKKEIRQVIAIGDNLNDLELLQEAEIGVAVANAHPDLKKEADLVTVDHNQNAVAAVIKFILEESI